MSAAALGAAGGCSSGAPSAPPPNPSFVVEDDVVAGSDVYQCSYVVPSAAAAFVVGVSHVATRGVHHVLVFRTDLSSVPMGAGAAPVDCFAGSSSPMVHMRGELYGSQALFGSLDFPADVGLPVSAGEVLLVQVHFQNATATDIDANVSVTFTLAASGISTNAGVFFFDDPFIDVPAGAFGSASMSCLVPNDITLLTAASHDHARAQSVAAYIDPPGGPPAPIPFYSALDAANPLPLQASVPVAAGSRLRFVCKYANVDGTQEYLQGLDEQNDEMCVLSGAYYPPLPPDAETCALAPEDFGTGTADCATTWSCVSACAAGTAPPADLGLSTAPDVDPCWQRCVVASCPATSTPLFALVRCVQSNCAAECASLASDACVACQAAACPSESSACTGDPPCGG
ncbi:MAG TPA: hypothetical protein VGM06_05140 [Polyangiaceae bacterium]